MDVIGMVSPATVGTMAEDQEYRTRSAVVNIGVGVPVLPSRSSKFNGRKDVTYVIVPHSTLSGIFVGR